jgi:copper chaperone CopZ
MKTYSAHVPAMFGDHHVLAVHKLLTKLPGIAEVYASSGFQLIEVQYDPAHIAPTLIEETLAEAGYLDALPVPTETSTPATEMQAEQPAFFRHTAAYAQTGSNVGFAQKLPYSGRPLWPCPGIGLVKHEG